MSGDEPGRTPLPRPAREVLAAYRTERGMPAAAFARVERRLASPRVTATPVAVIAAAAAAITIAVLVGLQSITAARREGSTSHELAGDVHDDPHRHRDLGGAPRSAPTPDVAEPPPPATTATPRAGGAAPAEPTTTPARPRAHAGGTDGRTSTPDATAPTGATLAAERVLLARAQRALTAGELASAQAIAAEHRRRFPDGVLLPELAAVEAVARCRDGAAQPDAIASAFAAAHPGSPLRATVREACTSR